MMKLVNSVEILAVETTGNMEDVALKIAKDFAKYFGGFNMYDGQGGWMNASGELITEKHIKVQASFGEAKEHAQDVGTDYTDVVGTIYSAVFSASKNQDAVSLKLNDDLYIIDTDKLYGTDSEAMEKASEVLKLVEEAVEASIK